MERLEFKFVKNPKYFSTARLLLSSILNSNGYNIEEIEDLKMALTEGLNISFAMSKKDELNLKFFIDDEKIKIQIDGVNEDKLEEMDLNMARLIINSVTDKCEIEGDVLTLVAKK